MRSYIINDYVTKILETPEEIKLAKCLIFQIYIQEQNWHIPPNNPSRNKMQIDANGIGILTDDFDEQAIWVGSFHNNKLVACGRIIKRDKHKLLEIERYPISNELRTMICATTMPNLVELNRSAILPDYRNTVVWPCLLHFGFTYCNTHQLSAISTTGFDKVKIFHDAIKFNPIPDEQFKYHISDKKPVTVYLADFCKGHIATILDSLEKIITQKITYSTNHESVLRSRL